MKNRLLALTGLFAILMVVIACRPGATPSPAAGPTPVDSATKSVTIPATPAPAAADDPWTNVVAAARKEGTVTAYSYNLTGDATKAAAEAFQNRYGIRLEIVGGVGSVLAERIKTENNAKKYVADTFDTGVAAILPLRELGLLASMNDLPAVKEKDAFLLSPLLDTDQGTMLRVRLEYQTTVINTNLVHPSDEPRSFLDFLDPRWKGKKLVAAPPQVSWPLVYLHVTLPDVINEAYFRALAKQDLLVVPTMRDEPTAVARGDAYAAVCTSVPGAVPLVKAGAPLKALVMKEGTISSTAVVSLIKNAPHPNAARVFVNWWVSPEGQSVINKVLGVPNIRKDVPDTSYEVTHFTPGKLLPLDEAGLRTAAKYVAEARVDKFLGMEVK